ncbi:MAG: tetratricopeptide repeat protein [Leptolyngbyaceae cyanobacterium RU_5_1]|nr:tetratricopeptide repeat protein [Leptolyngbyaceae cyanobacterium RU_5_1]
MLDQVAAAFERQDYREADQLVKELLKQSPDDPWVQFYLGRLREVSGKGSAAEEIYRQLLRTSTNPKLVAQARQGLQRLATTEKERRQQAIAYAATNPANNSPGFMILEAVTGEVRNTVIQNFARVMKVDAYTARGVVPSRGWRLYRAGPIGELQIYGRELRDAGVPSFWSALPDLQKIQVFRVNYFQTTSPNAAVVCQKETNQLGMLAFDWSEVKQRVEGILPIFSQVVDLGYRDRPEWKEQVEDYAHFCDLHLPARHCILRIHDGKYDFDQGTVVQGQHGTIRQRWNDLIADLNQHLPKTPAWIDFTAFSETLDDFVTPVSRLKPHIHLSRATDCYLDSAFHLYSTLVFLKNQ